MHREDQAMIQLLPALNAKQRANNPHLRWQHKDGTYRSLESNAIPLIDATGGVAGYRGTDRDVTERIRQQERLPV
jgi:PAS domain S-box-containing protein